MLEGILYGTTANARIKAELMWQAAQNIEENYSEITVTLTYSRTNSGYTTEGNWRGAITVGDQRFTGEKHIVITKDSRTVAMTATARIPHDEYGNLKLTITAEGRIVNPASSTLSSTTLSGEVTLDTIPRASAISAPDGYIGSPVTVAVDRKSDAFTHTISYRFGSLAGVIGENLTAQQVSFFLPDSFYGEIPGEKSGVCTLICETYSGDTLIGTREASFLALADPLVCAPKITVTAQDINPKTLSLTGDKTRYIRYLSTLSVRVEGEAQKGATLVSLTAQGIPVTGNSLVIENLDRDTLRIVATDSRGFAGEYLLQLPMLPYVLLTCNGSVSRTDPTSGDAVLTRRGNVWSGSFPKMENALAAAYTAGPNTGSVALEIGDDHTYFAEIPLTGMDYRQSHAVTVAVADSAMTVTQTMTLPRGIPVFDWGEGDFQFHVRVDVPELTVNGEPLADYIRRIIEET